MDSTKIVIIGSNYSAASVFYELQKHQIKSRQPFDILLISERNSYYFKNLLPQFLSSSCDLVEIGQEFRKLSFLRAGISYLEARIQNIDFEKKIIKTQNLLVSYDYLILSPDKALNDNETSFTSSNIFEANCPLDILKIQNHILMTLEKAAIEQDLEIKRQLLTFSIVGANRFGIEITFSVCDYVHDLLKKQFPELKKNFVTLNLIEERNEIITNKNPFFNSHIFYNLNKKGIKLYTNSKITNIEKGKLEINKEKELLSGTNILCVQDSSSPRIKFLELQKDDNLNIFIDLYCQAQGFNNIFLIGEHLKCLDLNEDIAPTIFYIKEQAKTCAYNVFARINNLTLKPLKNNLIFDFMFIGGRNSLVEIKGLYFEGFFAWTIHRFVYLLCLLGVKKKFQAIINFMIYLFGLRENVLVNLQEVKREKQSIKK